MIRELKFRAWDGEQMVSPDYITREGIAYWKENSIPCATEQVMQYTGLNDKYGKSVYEGDIIEWAWDSGNIEIEKVLSSTEWDGNLDQNRAPFMSAYGSTCGKYFRTFMNIYDPTRYAKVIGNIHQNPEML